MNRRHWFCILTAGLLGFLYFVQKKPKEETQDHHLSSMENRCITFILQERGKGLKYGTTFHDILRKEETICVNRIVYSCIELPNQSLATIVGEYLRQEQTVLVYGDFGTLTIQLGNANNYSYEDISNCIFYYRNHYFSKLVLI